MSHIAFYEEILPYTDIIPTATITWLKHYYERYKKMEPYIEHKKKSNWF